MADGSAAGVVYEAPRSAAAPAAGDPPVPGVHGSVCAVPSVDLTFASRSGAIIAGVSTSTGIIGDAGTSLLDEMKGGAMDEDASVFSGSSSVVYEEKDAVMVEDEVAKNRVREGRWTDKEHLLFLDGYRIYGKSWRELSRYIGSRTPEQIRTHAQKYFAKHEKPRRASVDSIKRAKLEGLSYDMQPALESLNSLPNTYSELRLTRTPVFRSQSGNLLGGGGSRPRTQSFDVSYQQRPRSDSLCSTGAESDYSGPFQNMALSILIKELEEQHNTASSSSNHQQCGFDEEDESLEGGSEDGRGRRRKRASAALGGWKNRYSGSEWAETDEVEEVVEEEDDDEREEDGEGYYDDDDDDSMDENIIVGFRSSPPTDGDDDDEDDDDEEYEEKERAYARQRHVVSGSSSKTGSYKQQSRRAASVETEDDDEDDDDEEYRLGEEEETSVRKRSSGGGSKGAGASRIREGRWSREEHTLFLRAYKRYGKAWKEISRIVVTRTPEQIRTHAQKYFQKQNRHRGGGARTSTAVTRGRTSPHHCEAFDDNMSVEVDEEDEQQQEQQGNDKLVSGSTKSVSRASRPRRSTTSRNSGINSSQTPSAVPLSRSASSSSVNKPSVDDEAPNGVTTSEGVPSSPDAESRLGGGTTEEDSDDMEVDDVTPAPVTIVAVGGSSEEDLLHQQPQRQQQPATAAAARAVNRRRKSKEGRWTKEEHDSFLEGLRLYGKSWRDIQTLVKTRTPDQIRTHAQKYFIKLGKDGPEEQAADAEVEEGAAGVGLEEGSSS